jgi:hypothetical protein
MFISFQLNEITVEFDKPVDQNKSNLSSKLNAASDQQSSFGLPKKDTIPVDTVQSPSETSCDIVARSFVPA